MLDWNLGKTFAYCVKCFFNFYKKGVIMFTQKQLKNNSKTTQKRFSLLILLFFTMIFTSPYLKAQYEPTYEITTPSDCVGLCSFTDYPWESITIPVTIIDENGVPCTFTASYKWRYCNGKLYIQNQEVYSSRTPDDCFRNGLRNTTLFVEGVYTTALEYLVAQNSVSPSDTANCYLQAHCVKWCCYTDPFAQVDRAFMTNCTTGEWSACCKMGIAYDSNSGQAYRLNPLPSGFCAQPFYILCAPTYLYDGRLLNVLLIQNSCETQCEGF
jgi:hypothetical protein